MSEAASTQCHISPLTTHNTLWQKTKKNPSPLTTHNTLWQKTKKNPQLDITPTGDSPFLF